MKIAREGLPKYYLRDTLRKREIKFHIDRYLKTEKRPLANSWGEMRRVFLPFWRVSGTVFSIREISTAINPHEPVDPELVHQNKAEPTIDVKVIPKDMTFCGNVDFAWGLHSLGVRSQVLKLMPVDDSSFGGDVVVPLTISQSAAEQRFRDSCKSYAVMGLAERSASATASIGIDLTLIFFPCWIADFSNSEGHFVAQFDPIAGRVVSIDVRDGEMELHGSDFGSAGSVTAIPHRCPNCGTDLPPSEKSLTAHCSNCNRLFVENGAGYRELHLSIPDGADIGQNLLPMWVFDISSSGRLASELRSLGFFSDRFFVPAFDISNPLRMVRLISFYNNMKEYFTIAEPQRAQYNLADVVVSPGRAQEMILPLAHSSSAMRGQWKGRDLKCPDGLELKPQLIWLPFHAEQYFWQDELTGATIEKAAVRF